MGEPVWNLSFVEHRPGSSEALADRVPAVYDCVDANSTPGQFDASYQLRLDSDDMLAITVQMEIEEPR